MGHVTEAMPITHDSWSEMMKKASQDFMRKRKKEGAKKLTDYTVGPQYLQRILQMTMDDVRINMVWYIPAAMRQIRVVDKPAIMLAVPDMVFSVSGEHLSVYALKHPPEIISNSRGYSVKDQPLYLTPFGNGTEGVCTGNVKLPKTLQISEFMNGWENVYFESNFTSLTNGMYAKEEKFEEKWKKAKTFPLDKLHSTKHSINSLIKKPDAHL